MDVTIFRVLRMFPTTPLVDKLVHCAEYDVDVLDQFTKRWSRGQISKQFGKRRIETFTNIICAVLVLQTTPILDGDARVQKRPFKTVPYFTNPISHRFSSQDRDDTGNLSFCQERELHHLPNDKHAVGVGEFSVIFFF